VKSKKIVWLVAVIAVLLMSLLANQLIYVYQAALVQEAYFNDKANTALEAIVNDVSEDYAVCESVSTCLSCNSSGSCGVALKSKNEWNAVDSIIQSKLALANIDLKYNFDFCSSGANAISDLENNNAYSLEMDDALAKKGILMYLEFPSKSNYIFRQMGTVFISSILIILLITTVFIILFRYYRKEKRNAERTRDFLNNMTHEFKTPLANIAFANNLLRRNPEEITPEKIKKYTKIIQTENESIIESSDDILEMAKHEYDFAKIQLENVDVHDILYDLQKSFKLTHTDAQLDIVLALEAMSFSVKGKTSFLRNALSNIIENAIKYCDTTPQLSISTANEKGELIVSIKDNGIGIAKAEMQSIFDKFYRVPTGNQHDVKGFGLGLSTVKMIVEQLKGSVAVRSNEGRGSTFVIQLPTTNA